jgi:hypothetical protein
MAAQPELVAFAEDPGVLIALGPDEERVLTDRYCVTFAPGEHFWSTVVERLRFDDDAEATVAEVHRQMAARGRSAAAWRTSPSTTPADLHGRLVELGMESESDDGSEILLLTEPPKADSTTFDVRIAATYEDHVAAIEVYIAAFEFPEADADDERRRARETFESERLGGHAVRLVAFDGDRPVAAAHAWFSPLGLYLGGVGTLAPDRARGAMSELIGGAWEEAVRRGTPALTTHGGRMAASALRKLGFESLGRVHHLVDRTLDGS